MERIKGKADEKLSDFYLSFNQSLKMMEIAKSKFKKNS